MTHMRRRQFITLLGGAAAAPALLRPHASRAQQDTRVRRIGWLVGGAEDAPGTPAQRTAFREALAKLGWVEGRNLRIELRYGGGIRDRIRVAAAELAGLAPDVIVTNTGATTVVVQEQTRTIPIVFTSAGDPVATGLLHNIARPEGNTTGFSLTEPSIGGKWLELLKEAAPRVSRVALIFNPEMVATGPGYFASIEAAVPSLSLQAIKMPVRDAVDIVRGIDAFAATPNGGLPVLPPTPNAAIFDAILRLAAEHRLPAMFGGSRALGDAGGLVAYGTDVIDPYRSAAS
jgi:putative ABC transport system substrate-binding protein